jgi:hypothetical protein
MPHAREKAIIISGGLHPYIIIKPPSVLYSTFPAAVPLIFIAGCRVVEWACCNFNHNCLDTRFCEFFNLSAARGFASSCNSY